MYMQANVITFGIHLKDDDDDDDGTRIFEGVFVSLEVSSRSLLRVCIYSCADLSVSILVILESSFAAGKCFLNLSRALFKLCILLRSLSFALTRLTRLMKVFSESRRGAPVVELLLLSIALCLAFSVSDKS